MNKEKNWHRSAEYAAIAALQRRLAGRVSALDDLPAFQCPAPLELASAIDANLPAALGISSTCVLTVPKLAP
jgi:hypothetical protein